jgi:hypothetical protein
MGWSLASYEIDLAFPGIREFIVFCILHIPFEPSFFFGKELFLTRQEIYTHFKIQSFFVNCITATIAASSGTKITTI